jgi:hypothetical protein
MNICDPEFTAGPLCSHSKSEIAATARWAELYTRIEPAKTVMRRPTIYQGRALEIVGHAIEYLVDSKLGDPLASMNTDAVRILMLASQRIFAECPEFIPAHQRLREKITGVARCLSKS